MARKKNEDLTFIPAENDNPAILGKLQGPCADFIHPTRNGRNYSKNLWKKVFNDEIVKETFANGGIMGELGHPSDRSEVDMEKVAIIMPEPPKENNKGELIATFDILNTPNGRILKTLVDYGYKIGISSRGTGDVYSNGDGTETVDEDTYDFVCFDAVVLPAVKSARLSPVTEALNMKNLKQALNEEYNKANDDEKRVMKETLERLELDEDIDDINESIESASINTGDQIIRIEVEDKDTVVEPIDDVSNLPVKGDDIDELEISNKEEFEETDEAEDFGLDEVVENLQKALKKSYCLEKKVEELQSQLSVSNAKEIKLNEEVDKYKKSTQRLSEKVKTIKDLNDKISQLEEQVRKQDKKIVKLQESLNNSFNESNSLNESIKSKDRQINRLENRINNLQKSLHESSNKTEQYSIKLGKAKELVEKYKKAAQVASDHYIESQARSYGLDKDQVIVRLSENFTLKDVDNVCESLSSRNIKINKLPFDLSKTLRVSTSVKNEPILGTNNADDDVDESLLRLANL